eukprot:g15467.t1
MPPLKKSIWYRRAVQRGDIDPSEEGEPHLQTEDEPDDERAPAAVRRKVETADEKDPIVFDLDPNVYDGLARGDLVPVFAKNPDPLPGVDKLVPIPAAARTPREQPPGAASSLKKSSPSRQKAVSWDPDVASIRSRTEQIGGSSSSSRPPPAPELYGGSTTSKAKAPFTAKRAAHSGGKRNPPPEPKEEKVFPDFDVTAGLYPEGPPGKEDFAAHIKADRVREYGVSNPLPAYIRGQISFQKETSAAGLLEKNRKNTKMLMRMAKKSEEESAAVMNSLRPHLRQVYEGKNFVLFGQLLGQVCDFVKSLRNNKSEVMSIITKLKEGFRNTGKIEPCGFWKRLPYSKIEEKKKLAASTHLEHDDESYVFNPYHSKDDLEQFYYQSGSFDPTENAAWMPVPYSVSHPSPSDEPLGPPDVNAAPAAAGSETKQLPAPQLRDPAAAPKQKQPAQARTIIHCYTDAALENLEGLSAAIVAGQRDLSQFKMVIGGFVYISEHDQRAFRGTLTSLPPSIHKMNIGILESLAARIAVDLWSAVMSNHFVVLHVDNLGDVFALARNSARRDITQNIVAAFHNIQYEKSLQVYTAWICTERNVADVLTREVRPQVLRTSFPDAAVQELTLEQLHLPKIWNANSATTSGPSSCLA